MAAREHSLRTEIRLSVQLHDSFRNLISVSLFLIGVLEKFRCHCLGMDALRHVVMALITQDTNQFGSKRLIEYTEDSLYIAFIIRRHRTFLDVPPCAAPDLFDIRQERALLLCISFGIHLHLSCG